MNIAIVTRYAYGVMTGGYIGHVGGVELQTSLTARWLAERGHKVSLITWDEGQPDEVEIDGVNIIKMCRQDAGLPGLRFFYPRWSSLNQAMKRADAALYYQNCAEYVTGQVALWCRYHGQRFVYSVASDPDCDLMLPKMRSIREKILYRYGLRNADKIIVQTQTQERMLKAGFGLESVVLPMPCPGPMGDNYKAPQGPIHGKNRVLWVGRIARVKRLELLLDIAEKLPEMSFDVAGKANRNDAYTEKVISRARALPNVTIHGVVPRAHMRDLYQNASLLCCTSSYEGFPNTFLEAWSYGLPIVSTVNPDNLLIKYNLGNTACDVVGLVDNIKKLFESPKLWHHISMNARKYYLENHTLDSAMYQFEKVFKDVLESNK